jgi:hypothetical protein
MCRIGMIIATLTKARFEDIVAVATSVAHLPVWKRQRRISQFAESAPSTWNMRLDTRRGGDRVGLMEISIEREYQYWVELFAGCRNSE